MPLFAEATAAAFFVRKRISPVPQVAVVLGSGLGAFAGHIQDATTLPFAEGQLARLLTRLLPRITGAQA